MYATCLFCNGDLGRNEAVEHFPVGRRLAWDAATGRLWVVCRRCERWNLTPLEERWEAIDEAERLFRGTRQRIATAQIALARLRDGLELVRIGAPPRLELATWRYGDQFGRRRRKYVAWMTLGAAAPLLNVATSVLGAAALVAGGVVVAANLAEIRRERRRGRVPRAFVPDGAGGRLALTEHDAQHTTLVHIPETNGWGVTIQQAEQPPPRYGVAFARHRKVNLRGEEAQRALTAVLPYVNSTGGTRRQVRDAIDTITGASTFQQLVATAARLQRNKVLPNYVAGIAAPMRLALEMALHEDDERRAMEGELRALEERWREADEIARIADSLLLPREIQSRVDALRRRVQ